MMQKQSYSVSRLTWIWIGLFASLSLFWILDIMLGSVRIPPESIIDILFGNPPANSAWRTIILDFRLPKSLTAILAGASLAIAGLQMQTLFHNPLADPYILGISSGASLGAAFVLLLTGGTGGFLLQKTGLSGDIGLIVSSTLGALVVFLFVIALARRVHTVTLLVIGVLVGYLVSAVVRIMIQFAMPENIQAYLSWTFGSYSGVTWNQLAVLTPVTLVSMLFSILTIKPLNALLLGETYARSLGINPLRARWMIIVTASLLAGATTAFCGLISFIGIAVPHLCRGLLRSSDHRLVLPACAISGGIVSLVADILTQFPGSNSVLPLNSITALIGAPVVIFVILRQKNLRKVFSA
jgi:iron complex transport system permease protein